MGGVVIVVSRPVHHAQHLRSSGFQEPPQQDQRQREEHDVQPSRVIPDDVRLDDLRRPLLRYQPSETENQFEDVGRARHCGVGDPKEQQSNSPAVISSIDVEDRQTIRSANRKAITPPKLMPPFHSTAARGTFPTEQTNDTMATRGPISGPTTFDHTGSAERKKACQNSLGTQAARAPAINKPSTRSTKMLAQSITK